MQTILTVVGARPQFVKAAVVSRALAQQGIHETIVHTGQHYDASMSDIFFDELGIPRPAHHLGVGSGTHGAQTGAMLAGIEEVMARLRPRWALLYGDTNSTLAGALAAAKLHVPIAHVEAGLRSFNRRMPEEVNRLLTDHLASLLLCPTSLAVDNLAAEGLVDAPASNGFTRQVINVGDVMFDATVQFSEVARRHSTTLASNNLEPGSHVLVTIHRAENTDAPERLGVIVDALCLIAQTCTVVWPVHPRTLKMLKASSHWDRLRSSRIQAIDPVGYLDMLALEGSARAIVTDSGGVQKEAFFAGVPCVTLRDETEWVELVDLGWNTLVAPTDAQAISGAVMNAAPGKGGVQPYGDGSAAQRIAALLQALPASLRRSGSATP